MAQTNLTSKFLDAALNIRGIDARDAQELAFMARVLVQATLPHSNPGDVLAWGRQNGALSLTISPATYMKDGAPKSIGLPYGS